MYSVYYYRFVRDCTFVCFGDRIPFGNVKPRFLGEIIPDGFILFNAAELSATSGFLPRSFQAKNVLYKFTEIMGSVLSKFQILFFVQFI